MKLVASVPDFFAHSGDAAVIDGEGFGCTCGRCGMGISAPFGFEGKLIWCLYCGIDAGMVAAIDSPWPAHRYSFGVTLAESREELAVLDRGGGDAFDKLMERRARKLGRVLTMW